MANAAGLVLAKAPERTASPTNASTRPPATRANGSIQGAGAAPEVDGRRSSNPVAWSFTETPCARPSPAINPKLAIGSIDDPLEREADQIADEIMRLPAARPIGPVVSGGARPCETCGAPGGESGPAGRCAACATPNSPPVVRRASSSGAGSVAAPSSVHAALSEPGRALPSSWRDVFEPRLGADLGHVRIHDDDMARQSADEIGALAYTVGSHIVFGAGHFRPGVPAGDRLLAHELVHTLQSGPAGVLTVRRQEAPANPGAGCLPYAPKDLNRYRGELLPASKEHVATDAVYIIWETWAKDDKPATWMKRAFGLWVAWRYGREPADKQAAVVAYLVGGGRRKKVNWATKFRPVEGCAYPFGMDQGTLDDTRRISGEVARAKTAPEAAKTPDGPHFSSELPGDPKAPPVAYRMPSLAADIDGFEVQPIGATGVYTMNVHWGDAAGGVLGQAATAGLGANYTWEVWDISGAPSVKDAELKVRRRLGLENHPDGAGHVATSGAGAKRDLQRAGEDLDKRPGQIDRDQQAALQEGRYADALGDEINRQLLDLGVVTRYGRELLGGLADVTGDDRSRRIPFMAPGAFVVRCVAHMNGEPDHRRAPSVATKIVVTRSAEFASQKALTAPSEAAQESRDTASVLESLPGADPVEIARLRAEAADRERAASGSPLAIIDAELAKTEADLARVKAASAVDKAGYRDSAVTDLEEKRDTLRNRRGTLIEREGKMAAGGAAVRRIRAALVSRVTGQTYQLLLEAAEPALVDGRWRCAMSDVTTQDSHAYEGFAPDTGDAAADKLAATRNALVALAEAGGYGAGSLSYILPEAPWMAGRSEAQRTATISTRPEGGERGIAGARQRLNEVAAALALLGIIVSGGTIGVAAGLLGAALAADNIVRRWREGTLHADAQLVGDLLNVLSAVAIGARVIGELAVMERAGGGILLRAAKAVGAASTALADAADAVSNVGGIVMANAQFVNDMIEIAEQESHGLSPSEARRRRLSLVAGAINNNALVVAGHMREGAGAHEDPAKARAAGERPPATEEHAPTHQGDAPPPPAHEGQAPQGHEQTMAGANTGGTSPIGDHTPAPTPGAAAHEQWAADTIEGGLGKRPPPLPKPGAPRVAPGETHYGLKSMSDALRVYDDFRSRAPGREVGIYRSSITGDYAVVAGKEGSVGRPAKGKEGEWGNVLHNHPDPDNSLTLRNPAPNDIHLQWQEANRRQAPVTAFIEHDVPGGGRAYTAVTVSPDGSIVIRFQKTAGSTEFRKYANMKEYSDDWGSRSRYAEPGSSSYDDHVRDLEDHRRNRERDDNSSSGTRGANGQTPSTNNDNPTVPPPANDDGPVTVRPPAGGAPVGPGAAGSTGGRAPPPSSVKETGFGGWRATWANDVHALVAFEPNGSGGVIVGDIMRGAQPSGSAGQMLADTLRAAGQSRPNSIRMSGIINDSTIQDLAKGVLPGNTLLGRTTASAAQNLGGRITGWTTGDARGKPYIEAKVEY